MPLRLVMMGTGDFAVPTLQGLYDSPHEVVGLVTQPDRSGRGHHQHVNPMKELATAHGTPTFQPESVKTAASLDRLRELGGDLFVVAAYGQLLSAELLAIPRLGAINLHASLLPKYRGAAPINYAILKGETVTGVTIFRIEPKLDAGPILGQVATSIGSKETAGELEERLAVLAVPLLRQVIDQLEAGTAEALPQDNTAVSTAPRMPKSLGEIDWTRSSQEIERHIRAMQPWPKAYTFLHQPDHPPLRTLILDVEPAATAEGGNDAVTTAVDSPSGACLVEGGSSPLEGLRTNREAAGGTVVAVDATRLVVRTGDQAVTIRVLQPAGKRAMDVAEFLRGHMIRPGDRFGSEG